PDLHDDRLLHHSRGRDRAPRHCKEARPTNTPSRSHRSQHGVTHAIYAPSKLITPRRSPVILPLKVCSEVGILQDISDPLLPSGERTGRMHDQVDVDTVSHGLVAHTT